MVSRTKNLDILQTLNIVLPIHQLTEQLNLDIMAHDLHVEEEMLWWDAHPHFEIENVNLQFQNLILHFPAAWSGGARSQHFTS